VMRCASTSSPCSASGSPRPARRPASHGERLGERVTADLRSAVYAHVVRQSPEFFETTQTGEGCRAHHRPTLVQTVVGSSLSMACSNAVMGIGAMVMLVTNPVVMTQVLAIPVLIVLPTVHVGRRVRPSRVVGTASPTRARRRRGAERGAGGRATRRKTGGALRRIDRARLRIKVWRTTLRPSWSPSSWRHLRRPPGPVPGTQAVMRGDISAGHLGQTRWST
jgi:ATP-binding cassette subfamily B protein